MFRSVARFLAGLGLLLVAGQVLAVQVALRIAPNPLRVGEAVTIEATVVNDSQAPLPAVGLRILVPAGVATFAPEVMTYPGVCPANTRNCQSGEPAIFDLGTLAAGQGKTVAIPTSVGNVASIVTQADVVIASAVVASAAASALVNNASVLALSLEDDKDPVMPGEQMVYALTYANRTSATSTPTTNTQLSMPLPSGVHFVSATGGGTLVGNTVQWSLGTLALNQSGRQQVVVVVDGRTGPATILQTIANISGSTAQGAVTASGTSLTLVQPSAPLQVAVAMGPDTVRRGEWTTSEITVTNRGDSTLTGVSLVVRVPQDDDGFTPQWLSRGGYCPFNTVNCQDGELAIWSLGSLGPGAGADRFHALRYYQLDYGQQHQRSAACDRSDCSRGRRSQRHQLSCGRHRHRWHTHAGAHERS
ncbi:MAG: hypothetical protein WDO68_01755 [Gammaproteobacteria bacterium]